MAGEPATPPIAVEVVPTRSAPARSCQVDRVGLLQRPAPVLVPRRNPCRRFTKVGIFGVQFRRDGRGLERAVFHLVQRHKRCPSHARVRTFQALGSRLGIVDLDQCERQRMVQHAIGGSCQGRQKLLDRRGLPIRPMASAGDAAIGGRAVGQHVEQQRK